ncbi:MAG: potassium-transporting ATPase subunit KdpB [Solirubrobacterales bacterium]|nr:potassium-transporting ATPase subunit KdpB [Solirubrobacterales bacterium]
MRPERASVLSPEILRPALLASLRKLDPRVQLRNPVMFVVEVGAVVTTLALVLRWDDDPWWFTLTVAVWLWLTVVFANLAEALAEGRGRAQAASLRAMRTHTVATLRDGTTVPASDLHRGDVVVVVAGEVIPGDGTVVEGIASVDESAITGESAPVIRESGGDRSAVTGGTRVLSDRIVVEITQEPGQSFLDRMIGLVEGAERRKTPNEIALNILLCALTIVFLVVVATLLPFARFADADISMTTLVALLVALIPTTIGALLSAIGIAGMDRLVRRNVLALSGRAVEASGDVDVLLLDKTGTITLGNRQAAALVPMPGVAEAELAEAAQMASLADETPEGRSIVVLAKRYGIREHELAPHHAHFVPFTAQTRMSGVDVNGNRLRKGATDAVIRFVEAEGGRAPAELEGVTDRIARDGGTPLAVARDSQVLGVIHLKDTVKEGMRDRFDQLRAMGIRTVMVTGDNRLTAAKIAEEAGVDDFLAEATPERKLELIRHEQAEGRLVAMTGDGTNDAPALAQADVGVAMNTGTQAAREAGNMVDLDSNPTKLIEIVEVGKQLLITRGALTTFSIANDVAKYFAILPAIFVSVYAGAGRSEGPLADLNVMGLGTPESAIISSIVFNAVVIPALVPIALRGVRYRAVGATALLRRNLLVYGLGGLVAPFLGIKLIDLVVHGVLGAQVTGRGHHKVFLGMAAGVGKTVRMLQEGRGELDAGRDVVVGLLETHGRDMTLAAAEGLERLPRRRITYRGATMEELDLPGVLSREPELCLVDELAHTNAPGVEHAKRYEDVDDVLDAGIDVFSTMNVQHLESLNDSVAELTGVRVRETVPDGVLSRADEVVIVDLTPQALLERLRAGNVYPAERIEAALNGFFRVENLNALRETALRQVAQDVEQRRTLVVDALGTREDRVDAQVQQAVGERLLALVSPYPRAQRLVRRAWRSTQRLGADLDLLWVQPPGHVPEGEEAQSLRALRELASVLGAAFVVEEGDDLAETAARVARERGATYVLLGKSPPPRGLARLREPLPQRIMRLAPGVDVRIVADRAERQA